MAPVVSRARIAVIGLCCWDELIVVERFPSIGSYAIVRDSVSLPGGAAANSAATLARLGADICLVSVVGEDDFGIRHRAAMAEIGVDTQWVRSREHRPTDRASIVVSHDPPDRTIFWQRGARLKRGDQLDIGAIFAHQIVIVDVDDSSLRRFLVDLPAHTIPGARLLGTMNYLAEQDPSESLETALRFDGIVGNHADLEFITRTGSFEAAIDVLRSRMVGQNLRTAFLTSGRNGSTAVTLTDRCDAPAFAVDAVDTTGAGDAFAGAIAYSLAKHWPLDRSLRFANAVAALSTRQLGAQSSLPTIHEVAALFRVPEATMQD